MFAYLGGDTPGTGEHLIKFSKKYKSDRGV